MKPQAATSSSSNPPKAGSSLSLSSILNVWAQSGWVDCRTRVAFNICCLNEKPLLFYTKLREKPVKLIKQDLMEPHVAPNSSTSFFSFPKCAATLSTNQCQPFGNKPEVKLSRRGPAWLSVEPGFIFTFNTMSAYFLWITLSEIVNMAEIAACFIQVLHLLMVWGSTSWRFSIC